MQPEVSLTTSSSPLGQPDSLPAHLSSDGTGGFWFNRKPRLGWRYVAPSLRLPDPPNLPSEPESWTAILLTSGAGVLASGATLLAYAVLADSGGAGLAMLVVGGAFLLTTLLSFGYQVFNRRTVMRMRARLVQQYHQELAGFDQELQEAVRDELQARLASEPQIDQLVEWALSRDSRVWERRPFHDDFLRVRLGVGDVPSQINIDSPGRLANSDLSDEADEIVRRNTTLKGGPFVVDLAHLPALGFAGETAAVEAAARAALLSLAVLYGPDDLQIALLASPGATTPQDGDQLAKQWSWAKWLPHCLADGREPLLACDPERAGNLLAALRHELARRRNLTQSSIGEVSLGSIILVVATSPEQLLTSPVGQELLLNGPSLGFRFLVLAEDASTLPSQCRAWLSCGRQQPGGQVEGEWRSGDEATLPLFISPQSLDRENAESVARALAPLRPLDTLETGVLPSTAHLVDVLGLRDVRPGDVSNWWLRGQQDETIKAVLGLYEGPNGQPTRLELDLERDGPHGLIAGTTGAGKSELLLTLITSLAWRYHPHRVGFLLVDYKGGAAFGPASQLPHALGLITDLDEHLANRSLVSLNAELKRRERVFRGHGAATFKAYQRLDGVPPLPHLVVIVDELAHLLKEVPDFVDGLVNVAQRGRSLGVHLILATQRPEGVVTGPIQANANFRVCLRVLDPSDSTNMIGTRDAADIPPSLPGRAYLRIAQSEPIKLQTARVVGSAMTGFANDRPRLFAPEGRPRWLPKHIDPELEPEETEGEDFSDLKQLVGHMQQAAAAERSERLPSPWPDPLPDEVVLCRLGDQAVVGLPANGRASFDLARTNAGPLVHAEPRWLGVPDGGWLSGALGLLDRPTEQWQGAFVVDLESAGHLLVLGTFGAGTAMALAALATSLSLTHNPDDLHIYALDFGSHALDPLATFPHCGAVVGPGDDARVRRLFRMLGELLPERREALRKTGARDWSEYRGRQADRASAPYLLVLLENFGAFAESHEALVDQLPALLRDGLAVGIHFAVSADQLRSIPMRITSLIQGLIVLRQSDPTELPALTGLRRDEIPKAMPIGRGFWRAEEAFEVQIAVPVEGENREERGEALRKLGELLKEAWNGATPSPIRVLPTRVPLAEVAREPAATDLPGRRAGAVIAAPFALDDDLLSPVLVDLGTSPSLVVTGPPGSGRSTALATVVRSLATVNPPERLRIRLAAPRSDKKDDFCALVDLPHLATGTHPRGIARPQEIPEMLYEFRRAIEVGQEAANGAVHLLVVDDYDLIVTQIEHDMMEILGGLLKRHPIPGFALVLAGKLADLEYRRDDVITRCREAEHALVLCPRDRAQAEAFGAAVPRDLVVDWTPGRAFYVRQGRFQVVQVALSE